MVTKFQEHQTMRLAEARAEHPAIHSAHEGYAILKEELDELWDQIKAKSANKTKMYQELLDLAAVCQRMAEDLELVK